MPFFCFSSTFTTLNDFYLANEQETSEETHTRCKLLLLFSHSIWIYGISQMLLEKRKSRSSYKIRGKVDSSNGEPLNNVSEARRKTNQTKWFKCLDIYFVCVHVWHREDVFIRLYAIVHKVFISWQWWRRVCVSVSVCVFESEQKCNQSISWVHHVHECLLKDRPNELSIPFINNNSCSKCSPLTVARCRWFWKPA